MASGLDYPSVGPEHAYLHECGRVNYVTASDEEAMEAYFLLCRLEGIISHSNRRMRLPMHKIRARARRRNGAGEPLRPGDKDIDYIYEHYGYGERFLEKNGIKQ